MNSPPPKTDADMAATLGLDTPRKGKRRVIRWMVYGSLLFAAGIIIYIWMGDKEAAKVTHKTQAVRRGDLTITVSATGNLEPTNQVEVGSELSGIVESVDVDYNDLVKKGQVLATLDTSKLEAQVLQSKAALESARAKIRQAKATIHESRSALARLKEVKVLSNNKAVSPNDIDTAQANLERALADEASAKAAENQAKAALNVIEADLSKAVIRSPINGMVLSRSVEPGQTVAASLQAPVLFTLAEDLTHMELHVDVDEADVAQVKAGQAATFTVDAYPDRSFPARITQVRYGPQTLNGVVTYETLLDVDNSDLSLRPGMTATADIVIRKIDNALLIPNAALRFTPPKSVQVSSQRRRGLFGALFPRPPHNERKPQGAQVNPHQQRVWVLQNGLLQPVSVTIGASDGTWTQVTAGDLKPGMELVVDSMSVQS